MDELRMRYKTLKWGRADYGPWRTEPLWRRFYLSWIKKPAITCHCKALPEPHVTCWHEGGSPTSATTNWSGMRNGLGSFGISALLLASRGKANVIGRKL